MAANGTGPKDFAAARQERLRRLKGKIAEIRSQPSSGRRVVVRPSYSPEVLQALAELDIEGAELDEDGD